MGMGFVLSYFFLFMRQDHNFQRNIMCVFYAENDHRLTANKHDGTICLCRCDALTVACKFTSVYATFVVSFVSEKCNAHALIMRCNGQAPSVAG